MRVQKKHMYTYTHTARQDAAESHRHHEYKSQTFACIISEISQALWFHKAELFKTNMEKQDCTLKKRIKKKNKHYLYLSKSDFVSYSIAHKESL